MPSVLPTSCKLRVCMPGQHGIMVRHCLFSFFLISFFLVELQQVIAMAGTNAMPLKINKHAGTQPLNSLSGVITPFFLFFLVWFLALFNPNCPITSQSAPALQEKKPNQTVVFFFLFCSIPSLCWKNHSLIPSPLKRRKGFAELRMSLLVRNTLLFEDVAFHVGKVGRSKARNRIPSSCGLETIEAAVSSVACIASLLDFIES